MIDVGQIVNTHGIRGEVKLNPWTDDLYDLLDLEVFYDKDGKAMKVESSKVHKNVVIIKFSGINTMNDAEKMKGKRILIIDDVISTGESLAALEALVNKTGGSICGRMAILAEGDAQTRDDLIYLEKLPLFNPDGSIKA